MIAGAQLLSMDLRTFQNLQLAALIESLSLGINDKRITDKEDSDTDPIKMIGGAWMEVGCKAAWILL